MIFLTDDYIEVATIEKSGTVAQFFKDADTVVARHKALLREMNELLDKVEELDAEAEALVV